MKDTLYTIKCPACGKDMVKIYIPGHKINVDVCLNGCGGIFFDNRELEYFDEQNENIDEIIKIMKEKTFEKVNTSLPRTCPSCGAKMVKNFTSVKRKIEIDECYTCGGKFLDHDELIAIRDEYKNDKERSSAFEKYFQSHIQKELNIEKEKEEKLNEQRSAFLKFMDKFF